MTTAKKANQTINQKAKLTKAYTLWLTVAWFGLACATHAYANSQQDDRRLQDVLIYKQQMTPIFHLPVANLPSLPVLQLEEAALLQQPKLLERALGTALLYNHDESVAYLLPLYTQLNQDDINDEMLLWAKAVSAYHKQDYRLAIGHYRTLLARFPTQTILRLQLAMALFADRQFEAADSQFAKLQAQALPDVLDMQIKQYRQVIQEDSRWHLMGNVSYIHDRNINNAPNNPTLNQHWTTDNKQAADGISANMTASKQQQLSGGFFGKMTMELGGKYYNLHQYNELNTRMAVGLGHQTANYRLEMSPFWSKQWYAGGKHNEHDLKPFADSQGIHMHWHYQFSPKWQAYVLAEYAKPTYQQRTHLDGKQYKAVGGIYYRHNPRQYWQMMADYGQTLTQEQDDSFTRHGVRISYQQEWASGLSTQLGLGYAKRDYHGVMPIFNQTQRNHEYTMQASLWHRNVYIYGTTPRITWQYIRQNSTIPLYDYRKNHVFVEFQKSF